MTVDKYNHYLIYLKKEITKYLTKHNIKNVVLGLSGGIDSAVALAILSETLDKKNIKLYFIDINSKKEDKTDAIKLAQFFNVDLKLVDLTKEYTILSKKISKKGKNNLKARLRMIYLYDRTIVDDAILIGTTNYNEAFIGYHTKHGDSASDLNILNNFIKKDIYNIAKIYNIPKNIINKEPSAGFNKNQTDEKELGITYKQMDDFFTKQNKDDLIINKMNDLYNKNSHKLKYNNISKQFKRYKGKLWN